MALFPEFDIVVEVEELRNTAEDDIIQATAAKTAVWEGAEEVEEGDQEDAKLSQKDYNAALGNQVVDPNYVRFLTRVRRGGEHQILRYCRWPATEKNQRVAPLYMHSANAVLLDPTNKERTSAPRIAAKDVPNCSNCGAERRFEFQVRNYTVGSTLFK